MAPITKTLALAGAFFALTGYSAPVAKRAVVWETVTDIVWTTVDVTTTVYPQAAHTATVPVVANAVPTTTAAPVVEASTKEVEKAAPTTTSSSTTTTSSSTTTTAAPVPTVEAPAKQVEQAAPTTSSSSTTTAAPAPTVEAETSTTPAPVVQAETSSTAAPTATRSANTETTNTETSSGRTGVCSESSPCDGDITFYDTATTSTNPSSCGTTNDGTVENVLALPHGIMTDSDCGKTVTITYNGQTATGIVVDKCMGCDNGSVDLSRHFFGQLASMDQGRVSGAKWYIH